MFPELIVNILAKCVRTQVFTYGIKGDCDYSFIISLNLTLYYAYIACIVCCRELAKYGNIIIKKGLVLP